MPTLKKHGKITFSEAELLDIEDAWMQEQNTRQVLGKHDLKMKMRMEMGKIKIMRQMKEMEE